jgi:hypothetical protein
MHPDLQKIAQLLNDASHDTMLSLHFSLRCIEDISHHFEDEAVIVVFKQFRACVMDFTPDRQEKLTELATLMNRLAESHPGSSSIDGTRHAAVSATYALAKAVNNKPVEAAAYAAYSYVYGYGGYAVTDAESFKEVHQRQMSHLLDLHAAHTDEKRLTQDS